MPISRKSHLLYLLRALGGFHLARYLTRKRLRILCYHGFSVGDEFEVMPLMFMRKQTFERRMDTLKRWRFPVIPIDDAVKRLRSGSIDAAQVVVTMDDGWATNLSIALPILERHGYPVCIYVNTEHFAGTTAAFNVALYYMIRKSAKKAVTLSGIHPRVDGTYELSDAEIAVRQIIQATESAFPLPERQRLLPLLAGLLDVDAHDVLKPGRFSFLNAAEIQELARRGAAIELHTHTHRLPVESFDDMANEILTNRRALQEITGKEALHFCYPSGMHDAVHPQWLSRLHIESATTCDPGMNTPDTPTLLLKRFLDSDETTDISFEAEICGVGELVRDLRQHVVWLLH